MLSATVLPLQGKKIRILSNFITKKKKCVSNRCKPILGIKSQLSRMFPSGLQFLRLDSLKPRTNQWKDTTKRLTDENMAVIKAGLARSMQSLL